ncbi:uncharacterized protein LOC132109335 [Carassius carassius]|uniref:uncharacterized protein LOC132109335 n=1 Tax=Carassius carassius TaxID=217509 RepID=UPI002868D2AC|nr:uncharacterized protein LOC132109335 [Carassius carassius]
MSLTDNPITHWEDLENWLSVVTCSLVPKAADNLRQHTQEQLDANISDILTQDPTRSYKHKEIVKITGSLSHTLIASLKLSDEQETHLRGELTRAKQRINQLELDAQDQQEGSDEVEPGTKEEIERLQETLTTTSPELEQAKAAQDDLANKLQYAEQLLEKAKADFRDKNSRIKALDNHLERSRNQISGLIHKLDYVKEESDSIREELKHIYELHPETTRTRHHLVSPLPSRAVSPIVTEVS